MVDGVAAVDRHLVVIVPGPPADLGCCWFGDPTRPCDDSIATVATVTRMGRPIERPVCRECIVSALSVTCDDGNPVTLIVPTSGTLTTADVPGGAQLVGVG